MTAPVRTFFSLVRTKAPPLPGLTCWNSTTVTRPSGRSSAMPFLRSLVETFTRRLSHLGCSALRRDAQLRSRHGGEGDAKDVRHAVVSDLVLDVFIEPAQF